MSMLLVALYDIPPQGAHMVVDDPAIFDAPIAEFGMECRITAPLRAEYDLTPMDGGCLVRGLLTGAVVLPCDRCAEDCPAGILHTIETFAPYPGEDGEAPDPGADDAGHHVRIENNVPVLDLAALTWEEFVVALPHRPLCTPECKGLCVQCGANLNTTTCDCVDTSADPRFAALRSLQIQKTGR